MTIKQMATLSVLVALAAFLALPATHSDNKAQADPYTDVVIDWNLMALSLPPGSPGRPNDMRHLAMTHAAMHDAINSIVGKYQVYGEKIDAPPGASPEAAAAAAAHGVLIRIFPGSASAIDAQLAASLAGITDGSPKDDGIAVGEAVGEAIFNLRDGDGHDAPLPYVFREGPGEFQAPPHLAPGTQPFGTQWCCIPPFVVKSPSQFRGEGPPALDSREWARDYNEVKSLGRLDSATRTADQSALAHFWIEGSVVTWNRIARIAAADQELDMVEKARLFALLNLSLADAFIASWDTKFHYNFWRPVTAIRAGDTDGNPNTVADPEWESLVLTPNHPDYNSGHAVFAGAGAQVLRGFFGTDKMNFSFRSTTSQDPEGEVRSYRSFSEAAQQCADSRVWNGFHTRSAVRHGLNQGKQVGQYVFIHSLQPVERGRSP